MIHLHIHSNYTLLSGASSVESIVEYAQKEKIKTLALTDSDGMYGLIKFFKLCTEAGIKPILGAYITDPAEKDIYTLMLAKNNKGYSELCKIITSRKLNEDFSLTGIINTEFNNLYFITPSIELLKTARKKENIFAEVIATKSHRNNTLKIMEFANSFGIKIVATNPVYFLKKRTTEYTKYYRLLNIILQLKIYLRMILPMKNFTCGIPIG